MPQLTRKQFAEECGDDEKKLNVWISRKKIYLVPDNPKLIDTDNAVNRLFIYRRRIANKLQAFKPEDLEEATEVVKQPKAEGEPEPKKNGRPKAELTPQDEKAYKKKQARQDAEAQYEADQDKKKRQLEIEKAQLDIQQKTLMLSKAAGELLPVELVDGILKRYSTAIFKNIEKGMEKTAQIYADKYAGGDQKAYVRMLADGKTTLTKAIQNAGDNAAKELEMLLADTKKQLARGQKRM